MADDGGGGEEAGPGTAYGAFIKMEEFVDKLKLMQYEDSYCRQLGMKPVSKHYFALPTNPGEQFHAFTSLAAWLLRTSGKQFEQPQEYDDPNATVSNILEEVRKFGHTPDFPPAKLKTGCGDPCIWILDKLADEALKNRKFSWKRPAYPEEEEEEENVVEDNAELTLNKMEDELEEELEEEFEEEEHILGLDDLKNRHIGLTDPEESSKPQEILESTTDTSAWQLEVERVLPQLKVTIRTDNKDWRVHVDQMQQHESGIAQWLQETRSQLNKLHEDIGRTLEKIGSRERYINQQLEHMLNEFRGQQDLLAETRERYRQCSGGVTEKSKILAEITEELEKVKQDMDERGTSMTDGAPLVKVKQAIGKLRNELTQMDIRLGVLQHILLQAKLKEKTHLNRSANALLET